MSTGRIFIAGLMTETNTFSPITTDMAAFEEQGLYRGDGTRRAPDALHLLAMRRWRDLAEAEGWTVAESITAFAQPAGKTEAAVYAELREKILKDLRSAGAVDMVLLNLHGAMVAEGTDDCEGDLLAAIRAEVGPDIAVAALLDLHAHLTAAMVRSADLLIAYKHYPHDDIAERADELYRLTRRVAADEIAPVPAVADCRMIGLWPTTGTAMASIVRGLTDAEAEAGVLSVSLVHGFPWGDVAEAGSRVLVYGDGLDGDGKGAHAERAALRIAERFHAAREEIASDYLTIDAALVRAANIPQGPVVLADVADNAGGGAPSDSTFLLEEMLKCDVRHAVSGCYFDPESVERCFAVGEGARVRLDLGGKHGPASGRTLAAEVIVRTLKERHSQTGLGGSNVPLGRSALVEVNGIAVAICSVRAQVFAPDAFTGLGVDLPAMHIVALKSTQHFNSRFAPVASEILYVAAPGAISPRYDRLVYTRRDSAVWPIVRDAPPPHLIATGAAS